MSLTVRIISVPCADWEQCLTNGWIRALQCALLIGTVSNRGFTLTSLIPWAKGDAVHSAWVAAKEPHLEGGTCCCRSAESELRSWSGDSGEQEIQEWRRRKCTCLTCGEKAHCSPRRPAPPFPEGNFYFYYPIRETDLLSTQRKSLLLSYKAVCEAIILERVILR